MRSKLVRVQLIIFAVISVLAVGYGAYAYAGFQRYTGIGTYTVTADLTDAGGLYPNALVTYNGVDVGVVTAVDPADNGAQARLQVKSDFHIPSDSEAYVRSVSAAGEQFIDLVPTSGEGSGFLQDGSRIPQSRTNIPIPATDVINKVQQLLAKVPKSDLHTTLDEASTALRDIGPDLNSALTASSELVGLASQSLDQTTQLLVDTDPLLTTVVRSGPDISSFATDLASFTGQLAMSDNDIRTTLDTGPAAIDSATGLLGDLTTPLPILLANLQTVGEVLRVNVPGIRHILVVYPAIATAVNTMEQGFQDPADRESGQGELDLKLGNTNNPPPCTSGYGTQRRNPGDLSPVPVTDTYYCNLPKADPRVTRGARNVPCATDPSVRTAEVARCPEGLPSTWPQMLSRPNAPYQPPPTVGGGPADDDAAQAVPYDPRTGRFRAPTGAYYSLGSLLSPAGPTPKEKTTWQQLFPQ
ncbi:MCE family protein [uncultured Gordonia sp.]|uniref:MCE family protein n=1 Tax=uncultured Gordonia sp. TaxID=198437 RepID=UPI002588D2EA|nr:MlaD family protein [uncultured Gordonia sp.]